METQVFSYDVCQRCKVESLPYPGLLQPLQIPSQAWESVSIDFIEQLPKSEGKDTVLVVVDRFTKFAHFIALSHPFTAEKVAKLFLENVFKLHGMPTSIISDRDKIFTSLFWQHLFQAMGTKSHLSSAYYPQSDGQTERLNRCLENYLRCMTFHQPYK